MAKKRKSNRVKKDAVIPVDSSIPGHTHYTLRQDVLRNENLIAVQNLPKGRNQPAGLREIKLDDLNWDVNSQYMVVYDPNLREDFLRAGIIGEAVGVGSRKSDRRFEKTQSSFTLSSYDVFYAYDELKMIDNGNTSWIRTRNKMIEWGKSHDPNFLEKYSIYRALRSRGFIVLDASNYGSDFAIYTDSVEEFQNKRKKDHAPILVDMRNSSNQLSVREMVKSVKLADRVQKDYIVMKAKGPRDRNGRLTKISDELNAYMVDVEPMGVDRNNDINSVVMRKLLQSNSFNVIDIEIKKERY